jgi:hypothetical protein
MWISRRGSYKNDGRARRALSSIASWLRSFITSGSSVPSSNPRSISSIAKLEVYGDGRRASETIGRGPPK